MTDKRYKKILVLVLATIIIGVVLILSSCKEKQLIQRTIDISYVDGFRDTVVVTMPIDGKIVMNYGRNTYLPYLAIYKSSGVLYDGVDNSLGVIRYKIIK